MNITDEFGYTALDLASSTTIRDLLKKAGGKAFFQ